MSNRTLFFLAITLLAAASTVSVAQQNSAAQSRSPEPAEVRGKVDQLANSAPKRYYKLSYVLRESDEGRVLNQRTFIVTINPEATNAQGEVKSDPRWWSMRAGTRVPLATGGTEGGKYNYADFGVNLDSRGYEVGDAFQLEVSAEISSVATESPSSPGLPLIRMVKVRSAVLARFGQPTVVFTVDDPASKHRFALEVTSTRER
ncbi:MAG TPA: hypothetical protein VFB04_07215 [Terriglobales bacterium]|nr:hypothetical protein [Terriglobales bacterium]